MIIPPLLHLGPSISIYGQSLHLPPLLPIYLDASSTELFHVISRRLPWGFQSRDCLISMRPAGVLSVWPTKLRYPNYLKQLFIKDACEALVHEDSSKVIVRVILSRSHTHTSAQWTSSICQFKNWNPFKPSFPYQINEDDWWNDSSMHSLNFGTDPFKHFSPIGRLFRTFVPLYSRDWPAKLSQSAPGRKLSFSIAWLKKPKLDESNSVFWARVFPAGAVSTRHFNSIWEGACLQMGRHNGQGVSMIQESTKQNDFLP